MKIVMCCLLLIGLSGCMSDSEAIKEAENRGSGSSAVVKPHAGAVEEDCDDKIKKTAEQKVEEAINLQGGGDEGCTLE